MGGAVALGIEPPSAMTITSPDRNYVLVTAARNEQPYIGLCIKSVLSQSVLPGRWVIVSDGSTDDTENIVKRYLRHHDFMTLVRKDADSFREGFSSKVSALRLGVESIADADYFLIGHLDADITLEKDYYASLLDRFSVDPELGIAGGYFFEPERGVFKCHASNSPGSVAGGVQLFRNECYREIGGVQPMPLGGEDWHAEIRARMRDWKVQAFSDLPVYHHNPGIVKRGVIREALREGAMEYSMGTHPLFGCLKCLRRIRCKPYFLFATVRLYGFLRSYLTRPPLQVTEDERIFLRKEQISRITGKISLHRCA